MHRFTPAAVFAVLLTFGSAQAAPLPVSTAAAVPDGPLIQVRDEMGHARMSGMRHGGRMSNMRGMKHGSMRGMRHGGRMGNMRGMNHGGM